MKGFQYNAKAHHLVQRKRSNKNETSAIFGQSVILPMLQPDRPNHKYIIKELMSLHATVEVNNLFSLQRHKH